MVPASPKRKDLSKLDEVPCKRRKFLEASTIAAAKVTLPQPSDLELVIPSEAEAQLALITSEQIVREVAPEVQEAPLEVQSPTLMIQGVLGELDLAGEVVDTPDLAEEEEEGSSSTPDAEDGKVAGVIQIFDSPLKQPVAPAAVNPSLELVQAPSRDEVIVMVEKSVPGGDVEALEELGSEEEARVTPAPGMAERVLTFVQTLNDSSPYYERLMKRRAFPSDTAPLSCEGHPFFANVLALPEMMKSFYNELFATESNIF